MDPPGTGEELDVQIARARDDLQLHLTAKASTRAKIHSRLGLYLFTRYEQGGPLEDIQMWLNAQLILPLMSQALEKTPIGDKELSVRQYNLGVYFFTRYQCEGKIEDLREAMVRTNEAVAGALGEDEDALNSLGTQYEALYDHDASAEWLEKAITIGRRSVAVAPAQSLGFIRAQFSLAISLKTRYLRTGNSNDLDECINLEGSA